MIVNTSFFPLAQINGCRVFNINASSLPLNDENFLANNVGASATVVEAGTGQEAKAENKIKVERSALKFKHIGKEEYVKPNLPYTGEVSSMVNR